MPKQVKPVIMFLILDYVYMKMRETKDKKVLVVDEAWSLLNKMEDASYIFDIVKTSRKFKPLKSTTLSIFIYFLGEGRHGVVKKYFYSVGGIKCTRSGRIRGCGDVGRNLFLKSRRR